MDRRPLRIVLTGFMGTGKSTVGRAVAAHLGWDFVDTDALVVARHGPIPTIFDTEGEAAFREYERAAAAEAARGERVVIATGGRTMLDPAGAAALADGARVFCLSAAIDTVLDRVTGGGAGVRPMLDGPDPRGRAQELLEERRAGYAAFEQVPTDGRTPDEIATDVVERWAGGGVG